MAEPAFLVVGHINKPHGTKGEVFVWPLTDRPETTFNPGVVLHLGDASGDRPDPFADPVVVETVRKYRRGFLVRFVGSEDRTAGEGLRDRYLLRPFGEVEPPAKGEVFYHQLLGLQVLTEGGDRVGVVTEVYEIRPADMLEVEDEWGRVRLIPFTERIVKEVDPEAGRLVIDPPEGLLDL